MSEHTKEPWEAFTKCPGECCWALRSATKDEHGEKEEISFPEMSGEDARRIVACVNACAGMPTDDLEEMVKQGGNVRVLADFANDLLQQRDKLLAALEEIATSVDIDTLQGAIDTAKTAIAEVKGGK